MTKSGLASNAAMLALVVAYFSYVFQVWEPAFLQSGMGDWGDPHFINFVLEHWYRSLTGFADPSSPPMFFPARGTLGYSHGLILYAPIYASVRAVLDPLQSHNVTWGFLLLSLIVLLAPVKFDTFSVGRNVSDFHRWVEAPITRNPACTSFVMKPASAAYSSRWDNKYVLYGVDASFVALNHSLPTLNGYSAWLPEGWRFTDPEAATYVADVSAWIRRNRISGVCEFDIETRTLRPFVSATR